LGLDLKSRSQNEVEKNSRDFSLNHQRWELRSTGKAKPKYDTPMLAVYAGQRCVGHLYRRRKAGFEAFNTDDRSIGLFGSQREAADALSSGPHRMAETAGATVTEIVGFS
jgi:hypothetical protein